MNAVKDQPFRKFFTGAVVCQKSEMSLNIFEILHMEQVLDFLFMQPVLSVRQLQSILNVSFPIA